MPPSLVSLGDASLSTDDLALLVPPAWFNDHLISFWFEHLRLHLLADDHRVALLLPNLVFFLSLTDDPAHLAQIADVHRLRRRQLIILPVNDSRQTDVSASSTSSGSHWTLLVYERASNICFYLDSLRYPRRTNPRPTPLVRRLASLAAARDPGFVHLAVRYQTNSYDCGAFVCIFAEEVVNLFLKNLPVANVADTSQEFTPEHIDVKRQEIGTLACRLVDQQHKADNPPPET